MPAGPTLDPEDPNTPLPCAGLHRQVVVGHGHNQSIEYLCAWPTDLDAIPTFNDADEAAYWDASNPQNSTMVAGHGVNIEVTDQNTGGAMTIEVNNPA